VRFTLSQLKHRDRNQAGPDDGSVRFDFSYSGIKTAVLRYVEVHSMQESIAARRRALAALARPTFEDFAALCDRQTLDLVASFQRAMVRDLVRKTLAAARAHGVSALLVTGGVAANQELRQEFEQSAAQAGMPAYFPTRPLATDNAAMIAAAAYPKFLAKDFADLDFSAEAGLALK